jgi:hypothetical protein
MGALAMVALVAGCAEQKPMGQESGGMSRVDTAIQDVKGIPEWVTNKNVFSGDRRVLVGVGTASGIRNTTLRRKQAEAQARNDLAATLQVYVAGLTKSYMAETTAGDMSKTDVEQRVQDTMKQVTEATLVGAQIVEYKENPIRNEAYALARLDLEQFLEVMKNYKAASDGFSQLNASVRDHVIKNAEKAHDQLNEELQKRKQG